MKLGHSVSLRENQAGKVNECDCGGILKQTRTSITWTEDGVNYKIQSVPYISCDNHECDAEFINANIELKVAMIKELMESKNIQEIDYTVVAKTE